MDKNELITLTVQVFLWLNMDELEPGPEQSYNGLAFFELRGSLGLGSISRSWEIWKAGL